MEDTQTAEEQEVAHSAPAAEAPEVSKDDDSQAEAAE